MFHHLQWCHYPPRLRAGDQRLGRRRVVAAGAVGYLQSRLEEVCSRSQLVGAVEQAAERLRKRRSRTGAVRGRDRTPDAQVAARVDAGQPLLDTKPASGETGVRRPAPKPPNPGQAARRRRVDVARNGDRTLVRADRVPPVEQERPRTDPRDAARPEGAHAVGARGGCEDGGDQYEADVCSHASTVGSVERDRDGGTTQIAPAGHPKEPSRPDADAR
jgi:hypothetical protein